MNKIKKPSRVESVPLRAGAAGRAISARRAVPTLAAVSLAAGGLVAAGAVPGQAGLVTTCVGTAGEVTVPGDLVVPAGQSCDLAGTTVDGDVAVRRDANLLLDGAAVGGDVVVQGNGFVSAVDATVAGTIRLRGAFGGYTEHSDLAGKVDARNSGSFYSVASTHTGNLTSRGGETYLESGRINGDLLANGDVFTDLADTVVTGTVRISQAADGAVICASEIDGNATVAASGGVVGIGHASGGAGCEFNAFGADLRVANNTADITISHNTIRGNLACAGNNPAPAGADNRIRGLARGQCRNLPAAPEIPQGFGAEQASDRRDAARQRLQVRTAAADQAAAQAGPARIGDA